MSEFHLFYSRYRQLPIIIAILVAGGMVFLISRGDTPVETTCAEPAPAILGGECLDTTDVDPAGPSVAAIPGANTADLATTTATEADWSNAGESGEVPFISLETAPDGMTDAGREMVAELEEQRDTPTDGPTSSPTTEPDPLTLDVGLGE